MTPESYAPQLRALELAITFLGGLATLALVAANRGPHQRLMRHLALAGYGLAVLAALLYAALYSW